MKKEFIQNRVRFTTDGTTIDLRYLREFFVDQEINPRPEKKPIQKNN